MKNLPFLLAGFALSFSITTTEAQEQKPVPVGVVRFAPDGNRLIIGYGSREEPGALLVWNIEQKKAEKFVGPIPGVSSLTLASNQLTLAYTPLGKAPQLLQWPSLERGPELDAALRGPLAFSLDSSLLATSSTDFTVHCCELSSGKDLLPFKGLERVFGLAFTPDGKLLAGAGPDGVILWEVSTGKEKQRLKRGSNWTNSLAITPNGRWLLAGSGDSSVSLWNLETAELRAQFHCQGGADRLVYSPAAQMLAASTESVIYLHRLDLDPPTPEVSEQIRKELVRLDDDSYEVRQSAYAAMLKIGFVAEAELAQAAEHSRSAEVRIASRRARQEILRKPLATLLGHAGEIRSISFAPDGKTLASAGEDGTVRLWDVDKLEQVESFVPAEAKKPGQ